MSIKSSNYLAVPSQRKRIEERKSSVAPKQIQVHGHSFEVWPGVYQTSVDTELMLDVIQIQKTYEFAEIGCGCGAVSLCLAPQALRGVACDINEKAVHNTIRNRDLLDIKNLEVIYSDVFSDIQGLFDVLIFNPPYNSLPTTDPVERMFWDPNDIAKVYFFSQAVRFLKDQGKIYFGWADFADLNSNLPFELADKNSLKCTNVYSRNSKNNKCKFYVLEFERSL